MKYQQSSGKKSRFIIEDTLRRRAAPEGVTTTTYIHTYTYKGTLPNICAKPFMHQKLHWRIHTTRTNQ